MDLGRRTGETVFLGVLGSDRTSVSMSTSSRATTSSVTRAAWVIAAAPRDLERQGHPRVPVAGGARGDPALAVARSTYGADRDEPARPSGRPRRGPPIGCLGDGRRADAGCVRDRRGDLRPSRESRGACAIGGPTARVRPRLRVARRRGDGRRARDLGAPRVSTAAPSTSIQASLRNGGRTRPVAAG